MIMRIHTFPTLLPDTAVKKLPRRVLVKLHPLSLASDSVPDDAADSSSVSEKFSSSLSSSSYSPIKRTSCQLHPSGQDEREPTYADESLALFTKVRFLFIRSELAFRTHDRLDR